MVLQGQGLYRDAMQELRWAERNGRLMALSARLVGVTLLLGPGVESRDEQLEATLLDLRASTRTGLARRTAVDSGIDYLEVCAAGQVVAQLRRPEEVAECLRTLRGVRGANDVEDRARDCAISIQARADLGSGRVLAGVTALLALRRERVPSHRRRVSTATSSQQGWLPSVGAKRRSRGFVDGRVRNGRPALLALAETSAGRACGAVGETPSAAARALSRVSSGCGRAVIRSLRSLFETWCPGGSTVSRHGSDARDTRSVVPEGRRATRGTRAFLSECGSTPALTPPPSSQGARIDEFKGGISGS